MNRWIWIAGLAMAVSIGFACDAIASDAIASGPVKPAVAYVFCYAFGSSRDGSAKTFYTGVFEADMRQLAEVQARFRKFLADDYGSQPDPRSGDRDITCISPNPNSAAKAQDQMSIEVAKMRQAGGKVVESGWTNK